jgi:hypothetical protein
MNAALSLVVMPGLVPGIHVFKPVKKQRRGWPGQPSPLWRLARP